MKPKLLIIDDDEEIRSQMKWALIKDYEVFFADSCSTALKAFDEQLPMVVLLDLGLPPNPGDSKEGLATLVALLSRDALVKIIIITGQGEKPNALEAVGSGAYDYLSKPVQLDELKVVLKRAFYISSLERELWELQQQIKTETFEGLCGTSPKMQEVFASIRKVANTDASVLILGESGTGKEMVAQAIHRGSSRKEGSFIAINCSAIPEALLESELFGHERGAFTGAHVQRKGRIEMASGGTLFLDEIGEIPLSLQVKLLRFLQEQCIERVGGRQQIQIDARVVAATNANLKENMAKGLFREDLFYRLAVVQMLLPPLRDREGDLGLLAKFFLKRFSAQFNKKGLTFDQEALRALNRHSWPGNVRELENRVKRAVIMADGKRLTVRDMELESLVGSGGGTLKEAREVFEREMIQQALRKYSGKIAAAATELGVSRPTLYKLMEMLHIVRE